jgi:hypothetical protein
MDMGSEHYCIPFLENLLSKLEKYSLKASLFNAY